jgi:hypothetical protein
LKIRRRRRIKKDGEQELKPAPKVRRDEGEYVKLSEKNESVYELQHPHKKEAEFEPVLIEQD